MISVSVEGVEQIKLRLRKSLGPGLGKALNDHIGQRLVERLKDHLDKMSVSRHTTADRLGAKHTRHFEFASGRAGGGIGQTTEYCKVTDSSVTLAVRNTPGLRRAFGPMTITPVNRRWLTIPIHKDAYGKRVADLRSEGRDIVRLFGSGGPTRVLAERLDETEAYKDRDGKKRTRRKMRPLYALVKKVVVPQDRGLLPDASELSGWMRKATKGFFRAQAI